MLNVQSNILLTFVVLPLLLFSFVLSPLLPVAFASLPLLFVFVLAPIFSSFSFSLQFFLKKEKHNQDFKLIPSRKANTVTATVL